MRALAFSLALLLMAAGTHAGAALAQSRDGAAGQGPPGAVPFELQLVPFRGAPRAVTAWERDGVLFLPVDELALLLDATLYWRSELARVTLSADRHEMAVTSGSDMAVIDATRLHHLSDAPFFWRGELLAPLDLVLDDAGAPRPWIAKPVRFTRAQRRLSAAEREGQVVGAEIHSDVLGWRLVLTTDIDPRVEIVTAERASFVFELRGVSYDPLLLPLPAAHDAFQGLFLRNLPDGLEVSFTPTTSARGYRVDVSGRRLTVMLGLDERDLREGRLRPFAAPAIATEALHVVGLDPGHGGGDRGASLPGGAEAELALDLCRRIAARLRMELGAESVLTRGEGESVKPTERARRATQGKAEILISVHVHERSGGPAAFVAASTGEDAPPAALTSLGFRPARGGQAPFLAASRLLARSVMDGVATALGEPPEGIFAEELPELMSAQQPAMILELGSGEAGDRWDDDRRERVAAGVAEGLRLYLLSGEESGEEEWR